MRAVRRKITGLHPTRPGRRYIGLVHKGWNAVRAKIKICHIEFPHSGSIEESVAIDHLGPHSLSAVGGKGGTCETIAGAIGFVKIRHLVPPVAARRSDPYVHPHPALQKAPLP